MRHEHAATPSSIISEVIKLRFVHTELMIGCDAAHLQSVKEDTDNKVFDKAL